MRLIIAILLNTFLATQCFAGGVLMLGGGTTTAGAPSCATVVASQTTSNETQNLIDGVTYVKGATFSASSGNVLCGVAVTIDSVNGGNRTLELRVGTSANLTSSYVSGSLEVTSSNNGAKVTIPLSSTTTGSTTYYLGVHCSNCTDYNNRVTLRGMDDNAYGSDTTWSMTSRSGLIMYDVLSQ